jgi:hypothetical protein
MLANAALVNYFVVVLVEECGSKGKANVDEEDYDYKDVEEPKEVGRKRHLPRDDNGEPEHDH